MGAWRWMALWLPVTLAACGGGGSGGGSGTLSTTPLAVSFQPAGTTRTYTPDSATVSLTGGGAGVPADEHNGASTVQLTTDAMGNLTSVTYAVQTTGAPFDKTSTAAGAGFSATSTPSATQLAIGLQQTLTGVNGSTSSFATQATLGGQLSSAAYGLWAINDGGNTGRAGTFAIGSTAGTLVPVSGHAIYTGSTMGIATTGVQTMALTGTVTLNADFGAGTTSLAVTNIATRNTVSGLAGTAIPDLINNAGAIAAGGYTGNISTGGYVGSYSGIFYGTGGATPPETAGTWTANNGSTVAIGSFGAKR